MEYFVDFCGYCIVEAKTKKEAENVFWEMVNSDEPLPSNIYGIEEIEEDSDEPITKSNIYEIFKG
jgi:hypothetical protein